MDKEQIQAAIAKAKDISEKRNFKQSFDLIINLKGIDLKKQEHQIDAFITLPHSRNRKARVCALVGPELKAQAEQICDSVILADNFERYKDKREIKKIANSFDFFIAQANIMPKVATTFGRIFGPRGKMPNPKAGSVVPPNANLKPLYEKLQKTVRITNKSAPLIQCSIGTEDTDINLLAENASAVYNAIIHLLPNEKHNIKDIYLKLTMGKPVKVGEKLEVVKETK
ncbi:50S ribosomal protein L1 [Candidatus Woesearchaeota archaeon]|nr:50S ribosomal protein L1 [Candidatus Woesearchaeota archaeon]